MSKTYCLICGKIKDENSNDFPCEHRGAYRPAETLAEWGESAEAIVTKIMEPATLDVDKYEFVFKGEPEVRIKLNDAKALHSRGIEIEVIKGKGVFAYATGTNKFGVKGIGEDGGSSYLYVKVVDVKKDKIRGIKLESIAQAPETIEPPLPIPASTTVQAPQSKPVAPPAEDNYVTFNGIKITRENIVGVVCENAAEIYGNHKGLVQLLKKLEQKEKYFLAEKGVQYQAAFNDTYAYFAGYPSIRLFLFLLQSPEAVLTEKEYALTFIAGENKVVFVRKNLDELLYYYRYFRYFKDSREKSINSLLRSSEVINLLAEHYLQRVLLETMSLDETRKLENDVLSQQDVLKNLLINR